MKVYVVMSHTNCYESDSFPCKVFQFEDAAALYCKTNNPKQMEFGCTFYDFEEFEIEIDDDC